jgi:predicted phosphodiesterase
MLTYAIEGTCSLSRAWHRHCSRHCVDGFRECKLAVVADIHGNLLALEAVLDDIRRRAAEHTINLGDCVSGPLWPRETMDLLDTLGLITVRGNHDRWVAETPRERMYASDAFAFDVLTAAQRARLGELPAQCHLADGIAAVHGTPADDNQYLLEDVIAGQLTLAPSESIAARLGSVQSSLWLCAHSHLPRVVHARAGTLIVNPGSVGCPAYSDPNPPAHIAAVGSPHARYALLDKRSGRWVVELIAVEYDWSAASARALENGRLEWAQGLATGFLASSIAA